MIDLPTTMVDMPDGQTWVVEMVNNILIEVLSSMAEQERETIKTRQSEGIAAAHRKGVKFVRPQVEYPANWDAIIKRWRTGEITAPKAMELIGTKRTTFYKLIKQQRQRGTTP